MTQVEVDTCRNQAESAAGIQRQMALATIRHRNPSASPRDDDGDEDPGRRSRYDGLFHTVEILDTAGSHHFPAMRELSIRSARGFVLVFSVDSLQSFHEAVQLWHLIVKIRGEHVPIILVGNKSDLIAKRQVPQDMAIKLSQDSMRSCQYIETSAKYNVNVSELFVQLLQHTYAMEQQAAGGPSSSTPSESCKSPQRKSSRKLSRRLGSLGNLPSIRRKSSTTSTTATAATPQTVVHQAPEPQIDDDQKCTIL